MASSKVKTTTTEKGSTVADLSKSQIKQMQTALQKAGYDVGSTGADGVWGEKTAQAVSAWKKDTGNSNTAGNTIGVSNYNKLVGNTSSKSGSSSGGSGGSSKNTNTQTQTQLSTATPYSYSQEELDAAVAAAKAEAETAAEEAYTSEYANDLANQQQNALDNLQDTYNINASQLANIYKQQAQAANESADDEARQQYILYKQSKDKLGEQLSSQGITGGASETALNSILNAYTTGLATNEKARQNALTELGNTYQNDLTDLQAQLSTDKADINNTYGAAIAGAEEDERNEQEEAAKAYAEQQAAADVATWNASVQAKINEVNPKYIWTDSDGRLHWSNSESTANIAKANGYKISTRSGVSDSVAEWNKSVSAKIKEVNPKYTWTDSDGKLHWSNDQATANTAKASGYKVTTRTDAKSSSNSSKKKVVKSSGGGDDEGKKVIDDPFGNDEKAIAKSIPSSILQNTATARYGNSTYGQKTASKGVQEALAYIKKQYQNKKITEEQANYLIKKYATS